MIRNKLCLSKEFLLGSRLLLRENTVATCVSDRSVDFSTKKCVPNDRAWSVMGDQDFSKITLHQWFKS